MKLLLLGDGAAETPLMLLLDRLGVLFAKRSYEQGFFAAGDAEALHEKVALIVSEDQLIKAQGLARTASVPLAQLFRRYASVLVFPSHGSPEGLRALGEWLGGEATSATFNNGVRDYCVEKSFEAAGPFAGRTVSPGTSTTEYGLLIQGSASQVSYPVRIGLSGLFTRIVLPGTEVFVISSSAIFDVRAEVVKNLDASSCFAGLVPLIFFLRRCEVAAWQTSHSGANVVIDDPNLKPNYGFVNATKLSESVRELGAAVSIGFIPWNHNRTSAKTVELFRANWPRLSLSVHGCDHTGAEFSTTTVSAALSRVGIALDRMRDLHARTGLHYDKIMVFPQGKFSAVALQALRQSPLLAAVNTELLDQQTRRGVVAGELLKPAITAYSGFPLFLRRPANEPLSNFALDLLLGKPCLVVMHHDFFHNGMGAFTSLVHSLNGLTPALEWMNLESIVSRCFSIRRTPEFGQEVNLLSPTTELAGRELGGTALRFSKYEPLSNKTFHVFQNGRQLPCSVENQSLQFQGVSDTTVPTTIKVELSPLDEVRFTAPRLKYRVKVAARRHLSEMRDNYLSKSAWASALAGSLRRSLTATRKPGCPSN